MNSSISKKIKLKIVNIFLSIYFDKNLFVLERNHSLVRNVTKDLDKIPFAGALLEDTKTKDLSSIKL